MDFKIKELYLSAELEFDDGSRDYSMGNTDVIVLMEREDENEEKTIIKYAASFFAYDNILALKHQHQQSGAYLKGKYFHAKNMLLIDEWSPESVRAVIEDLIEEGDFWEVFGRI